MLNKSLAAMSNYMSLVRELVVETRIHWHLHCHLRSSDPLLDADMFADLLDQLRSVLAGTTWQEVEALHPGEETGRLS